MSVLAAVCPPLPAAPLGALAASLPPWRRGVCAGLSLPRAGGGGGRDDDEAESACRAAPCRRRFPPAWPGAGEASGPWPALYSGSGDGAQARASSSPAAPLTGSRGARHGGCALHPSALQPGCRAALVSVSQIREVRGGRGTRPVITCASSERRRDREGARLGPWRVPKASASSSAAGSAGEWPPDPGSGPESFRLFLALLPLECAVANSGENDPCLLGVRP